MEVLPNRLFSGEWKEGHVQGIAVDTERGFVYYSFTTILLKTDLAGNPLGSVENLVGHLGCIQFDPTCNRLYGSLELKHDAIGSSIVNRTGKALADEDSFYLVSFDLSAIDRMGMDAEKDGVMRAVYLADVVTDYLQDDEASEKKHRYGCSGIDGTALGPVFGEAKDSPKKIMVAYGVYGDTERKDNDYQVILQYDPSVIDTYALPLDQSAPHHNGPRKAEARYFFFTGNTRYGIQNLEYDPYSGNWLVAVYCGAKETYSNFPLFVIDGTKPPVESSLWGRGGERGLTLTSARLGEIDLSAKVYGSRFPYGQTGMMSLGNGEFYFSQPHSIKEEKKYSSTVVKYRFDPDCPELFKEI
ncbi:MAG: hypothetical protein E7637_03925 [Ruminococcaceae bacterium]|nr:hypothetical protein [Oscillospiraceae bacterium]